MKYIYISLFFTIFQLGNASEDTIWESFLEENMEPIEQGVTSKYSGTKDCDLDLQSYHKLMECAYCQIHTLYYYIASISSKTDMNIVKIYEYHLKYIENLMQTIEASDCLPEVPNWLQEVNWDRYMRREETFATFFHNTRCDLNKYLREFSKAVQRLESDFSKENRDLLYRLQVDNSELHETLVSIISLLSRHIASPQG